MGISNFFKPDSPQKCIEGQDQVESTFRYWRVRVFYSIYIGYAFFYFTRLSCTFVMPALITDLGFEKSQLGFLCSLAALSYGISKFLNGVISDTASLRFFMGIGLIMTGVLNIFFGLSSTLVFFALFQGLNGFFQGWGSPPCAKLLTSWYSQNERGRWWGFWNTSHNIGGALIPLICAFAIQLFGWRFAMYFPGAMAILVGFFLINRIRDNPEAVGLPPVEKYREDKSTLEEIPSLKKEEDLEKTSSKKILFERVLKNKFMWILAISFFFVYVIRQAVNQWVQIYLIESKGFSLMGAGSCVFWFEIGGIFGSLSAGYLSDTLFKGRRGPVNVLFSVGMLVSLFTLWHVSSSSIVLFSVVMFMIGFLIFGPQMLIGIAAAEMAGKKAAGSATGFAGLFAYMGAAAAGYPFGRIIDDYSWTGFFALLGICNIIAISMLLPLWKPKMVKSKIIQAR